MKIKVCGMREEENVEALLQLPIDYIGFIFYKNSARNVPKGALIDWIANKQKQFNNIQRVGVFVNSEIDFVLNKVHDYQLDYVQLHGEESAEYCAEIQSFWDMSTVRRAKLIKVFAVDDDFNFGFTKAYEPHCSYFLFDTKGPKRGGNGQKFDWELLKEYEGETPFFLSGGIDEDSADRILSLNLEQLVGIDVNSKFETAPGLKDIDKLKPFVEAIKAHDNKTISQ